MPSAASVVLPSALAFGAGLALDDRLPDHRRRAIAWTFMAVGALTTVSAVAAALTNLDRSHPGPPASAGRDRRLKRSTRFPRKGDDDNF